MTTTEPTPSSVDDFHIGEVPETFVLCRTLGHAWSRVRIDARQNTATLTLQCSRCRTRREDRIGRRGVLDGRSYDYPDGYQHRGVQVDRTEYRYELVVRARANAQPEGNQP